MNGSSKLDTLTLTTPEYTRTVLFWAGPATPAHPLCIFLDGEYYLEKLDALPILEDAIGRGRIPPMSFAFVPSGGPQSRHEDFVCSDRYARFIADTVFVCAKGRVQSIQTSGNLICGLSLSGLASAHITLSFPNVFSKSLSQSGSFWWERKRFSNFAREFPRIESRHWLSVGDEEIENNATHPPTGLRQEFSQVAGVQAAVDGLRASGAEVRHHVYRGGHAFDPWRDELVDALQWLSEEVPEPSESFPTQ